MESYDIQSLLFEIGYRQLLAFRKFFVEITNQAAIEGVVPEPAGRRTFVGRRATGMISITLSWKQNESFQVSILVLLSLVVS